MPEDVSFKDKIDKNISLGIQSSEEDNKDNNQDHRERMSTFLKERREKKLSHRISTESQLLNCAKEELSLKRKMIEKLDTMDHDHMERVKRMSKTMETVGKNQ